MHMIRVVAAALLMAAVLMTQLAQPFFTYWARSVSVYSWTLAVESLSDSVFAGLGVGAIALAVFICLCVGLALWASTVVYAPLDHAAAAFLSSRRSGFAEAARRLALDVIRRPVLRPARGETSC